MGSLFTGSVQSWLAVALTTSGPLIALIVGFEGADWFLRRKLGETRDHAAIEVPRARGTDGRARIGRRV